MMAARIDVACNGTPVGVIDLVPAFVSGRVGLTGGFATPLGSLGAAAAACGEDHFNWYQQVLTDNIPPVNTAGARLRTPYNDPPPGGYGGPFPQWADNFPWYWDEGSDPPSDTPGFKDGYNRLDNEQAGSLLRF